MDREKEDAVAGLKMRRTPRLKPVLFRRLFEGLKAHASTGTLVLTAESAVGYIKTEDPSVGRTRGASLRTTFVRLPPPHTSCHAIQALRRLDRGLPSIAARRSLLIRVWYPRP